MNIGTASRQSRLPVKTIRYYEEIGLVRPLRGDNGYREFSQADLERLKFLQRSRSLGFSIEECRDLLSLYEDTNRASADVKAITCQKIQEVDRKIAELKSLKRVLLEMVEACHGDDRPDCPIMDDLSGRERTHGGKQH
ncbi:Cu(I)-responsive transcriptional regulator [Roseibium marinum]|uniref:Cu(I)-responsive transcriptional regulator n=1 Tax=Roseibium marinum TaxID=281252 RepID=A0A2S3V320_9HYPH|nr:Cu(I)-responsive transcriptional regulator [Roseibium marinum]POF34290.1 Cu(I)-responsive transcriptional regulator [Roseibium marinum]